MKAEGEWERFACYGRISDYLLFKDKEARESAVGRTGEKLHAGFCGGDRYGAKDDTGGRI